VTDVARGRHLDPDDGSFVRSVAAVAARAALTVAALGAAVGVVAMVGRGAGRAADGQEAPADEQVAAAQATGESLPAGAFPPAAGPLDAGTVAAPEEGLPPPSSMAQSAGADGPTPLAESVTAAGRPAAEVTVQILDGVGDPARVAAVAARLADLGYVVVARNSVRQPVAETVVLATAGSTAEAAALVAADPRFRSVALNERFSPEVDLHVLVGADWPG
jgi:hypothetical protein